MRREHHGESDETGRTRPAGPLRDRLEELQRRVAERPTLHLGDLLEIAEAQDRGAWPLAARLRGLRRLGR